MLGQQLAGALADVAPGVGPGAVGVEQRLPFSGGALQLLALAAAADAPVPFCRELRIEAGDELLLRWTTPVGGELRLTTRVAAPAVWILAHDGGGTYIWMPGAL